MNYAKTFVIDTNIPLLDPTAIFRIASKEDLIVLPRTVLDELDGKKSGFDEINFNAREFNRILADTTLEEIIHIDNRVDVYLSAQFENKTYTICLSGLNDYSKVMHQYGEAVSIVNDRYIIAVAKTFKDCVFVSNDLAARHSALSEGLNTQQYTETEEIEPCFTVKVNAEELTEEILQEAVKVGVYNVIQEEPTGKHNLLLVNGKSVYQIDEKALSKQYITPKNNEQRLLSAAITSGFYDIILCESPAGTGKTLTALSSAVSLLEDARNGFNGIVYIRNSIESIDKGEDIGYLKGDNKDKLMIYNHPLYDSLGFMLQAKANIKRKRQLTTNKEEAQDSLESFMEKHHIETMWVGEMRGRTIHNKIVILDELQNFSTQTLKLCLSRCADGCRVICLGNVNQQDNPYLNKYTNSLAILRNKIAKGVTNVRAYAITLTKQERGKICSFAEELF